MNGGNLALNGGKLNPYRGQIDPDDRGQKEPLPLKVLPLKDYQKKIPKAPPLTKDGKYDWLKEKTGISLDEIPE
jgi:hypothetical protein